MSLKKIIIALVIVVGVVAGVVVVNNLNKKEEKYTIEFMDGEKSYHEENISDGKATLPTPPTKSGYVFSGWFLDKSGTNQLKANDIVEKDLTVYAKWVILEYKINYVVGEDAVNDVNNPTKYTVEDTLSLLTAAKTGMVFDGWYKDQQYTKKVTSIEKGTTGDLTLYAKWVDKAYTITYHMNGGTNDSDNPLSYTKATEDIVLKNPTRLGHKFLGWYKESTFTTKVTTIITENEKNIDLYAKWAPETYNIEYVLPDVDNIDNDNNPTTYVYGTLVSIHDPQSIPNGRLTFISWHLNEDYSDSPVEFILDGTTGTVTLYAKCSITLTYAYRNDSTNMSTTNPLTHIVGSNVELVDPTGSNSYNENMIFMGWYTSSDGGVNVVKKITNLSTLTENTTLYAAYGYKFVYDLDGGTNHVDNPVGYISSNNDKALELLSPAKEGYTFGGWYFDDEFNKSADGIIGGTTGDITLYAKWIEQ